MTRTAASARSRPARQSDPRIPDQNILNPKLSIFFRAFLGAAVPSRRRAAFPWRRIAGVGSGAFMADDVCGVRGLRLVAASLRDRVINPAKAMGLACGRSLAADSPRFRPKARVGRSADGSRCVGRECRDAGPLTRRLCIRDGNEQESRFGNQKGDQGPRILQIAPGVERGGNETPPRQQNQSFFFFDFLGPSSAWPSSNLLRLSKAIVSSQGFHGFEKRRHRGIGLGGGQPFATSSMTIPPDSRLLRFVEDLCVPMRVCKSDLPPRR